MKKILLALFVLLFVSNAFCKSYEVVEVEGSVICEKAGDTFPIKLGMVLDEELRINTGLNSYLTIKSEDEIITIKPMRKGLIKDLCIKKETNLILGSSLTKDTIKNLKGIEHKELGRASEAKEDLEWE